jgi:cellobiose transport system substrate-binding protein
MLIASRRTGGIVGTLTAVVLLLAGCGSGSDTAKPASNAKVTLTVGLFGTFGYKEAGLYDDYMRQHPNVTIKEQSVEQEQVYYQALQTHLAANSGLADVQGIEVGRIAEVVQSQAAKFVDFNTLGGKDLKSTFFDWKWQAATTKDGKTIGLGTDTGPQAICFRKDLFAKAGVTTDREALSQKWSNWQGFVDTGKAFMAKAPAKTAFVDSAAGVYTAAIGQSASQYYDENGNLIYATNPVVKDAWSLAMTIATSNLTAKLKQFDAPWNQGFSTGSFATIACPAWMLGYINSQMGDAGAGLWDIAPLPGASESASNWGGSWLGVPADGENVEAAKALAEWLTAPEQQVKTFVEAAHFPSSPTAAEDPAVVDATNDYFSGAPTGQIFGQAAENIKRTPIGPYDTQIQDAFTTALTDVAANGTDPDEAFDNAVKAANQAIGG